MPAAPILTVTLNPALDLSTSAPRITPGPKLRCAAPEAAPGGGGVNVARVLARLGADAAAAVALGGGVGARLGALLEAEGVRTRPLPAPGETRESIDVTETETGRQWRFVLPGPEWTAGDVDALRAALRPMLAPGTIVVVSGSTPAGAPAELSRLLCDDAAAAGAVTVLDTSGPALHAAAAPGAAPLDVLRMDRAEAAELAGRPMDTLADLADLAAGLVARGVARAAICAAGAEGSVVAGPDGRVHLRPPPVEEVSRIGAGDSFVAGLAFGLAHGETTVQAAARGVAAAAAAVETPASRLCDAEGVARHLPEVVARAL